MTAATHDPMPVQQQPALAAPSRQPEPPKSPAVVHETPHDDHPGDEPGYGHGV